VNGQPSTLTLKEMLQVYLEHRLEVIRRRSAFRLRKAADRLHLVDGLLIAIVDIDDVIAIIRGSDDAAQARARLMEAFELTETQTNYILDMQLRRLTKFSRIELEAEREQLLNTIADLQGILDSDERQREVVASELDEVARTHGTPRRTVLLASAGTAVTASAAPLEVADDPCWVLLSSAGLLARTDTAEPLPSSGPRSAHDVIVATARTTARGEYGALTSTGRLIRCQAIDLPSVPITATAPSLKGGSLASELVDLAPGERILGLTSLSADTFGWALGTASGVVKRVNPEVIGRDSWEIIRLDDGDQVVGAVELAHDLDELVFVTSDAQLLHFPAGSVRPQGRSGGGMAGVKLAAGARVVFFGVSPTADAVVVSVAGASSALPGTEAGTVKVTPFAEYPGKGRATGGVRCQRFLKGEDVLLQAWVGPEPAVAAAASGSPVDLPGPDPRRDGSGTPAGQPIAALGSRYHP
ncbi:MAG: DNA gyrase subunit A, partial [Propionicimonas sp.]|nr:DNA gyrase subunit A [Propionicimonas sp.]